VAGGNSSICNGGNISPLHIPIRKRWCITKKRYVNIVLLATTVMTSSCASNEVVTKDNSPTSVNAATTSSGGSVRQGQSKKYTVANVQEAFEEYINYQMYFEEGRADLFKSLVGKEVKAEIRYYESSPENVYVHTDIDDWVALIRTKDGILYCDGLVQRASNEELKGNVIGSFSFKVAEVRKPNYGSSPRKDKILAAVNAYIPEMCKDFLSGEDAKHWVGAKIYLADFYGYESNANVWIVTVDTVTSDRSCSN
jgi:hypothetical protein